jgi:stage III sporulation protein AD
MVMLQLIGFAIAIALIALVLQEKSELFAIIVTFAGGLMLLFFVIKPFLEWVTVIQHVASLVKLDASTLTLLFKIIGIAYVAEIGGQMIRDIGQEGLAHKVELAAKMSILLLAVPIVIQVVETLVALFPNG